MRIVGIGARVAYGVMPVLKVVVFLCAAIAAGAWVAQCLIWTAWAWQGAAWAGVAGALSGVGNGLAMIWLLSAVWRDLRQEKKGAA